MSTKTILNKKAQYYIEPSYSSIHPLLIVGIALFILPFVLPVFRIYPSAGVKSVFNVLGVLSILIGGALSIFKASN